jgi:hypothetical protein
MNWVITIVTITLASGFATMFNIRKQNRNSWGDIKDGYESIWFASLIINLFIGFVVGIFAVALRWAVPYIIAVAIGIFLLCIVFSGIILNNDNAKSMGGAILVLIILLVPATFTVLMVSVNNADNFDNMITTTTDDLFENEIPDNMVRLVTEEYAEFVVKKQALGEFGSNRQIAATSIVSRNGRLVWVCVIVSTNTFAENYVQGMVVVDANNATVTDIIFADEIDFTLAEGLFWANNIQLGNYWDDASYKYTDAYPAWDDEGNLVYVQTRTHVDGALVERPVGPLVYYQGESPVVYDNVEDAPDWLPRAYSEDWLERQVDRWGATRRGAVFDFFAGGFIWIPPSNDRLEMSEDVRYILNPDTMKVEALVTAHPIVAELSLAGVFRGTAGDIIYHDYGDRNFIAGQAAIDNIVGSLAKPAQGHYEGAMPLLYPITIDNETKWTWYAPVYFYRTSTSDETTTTTNIELYALAMIDATDARTYYVQESSGAFIGENLVAHAKDGYAALFGAVIEEETGNETTIVSDLVGSWLYDAHGSTHMLIQTNNTEFEFIVGCFDDVSFGARYDLLRIEIGQIFQATIVPTASGEWFITEFAILS